MSSESYGKNAKASDRSGRILSALYKQIMDVVSPVPATVENISQAAEGTSASDTRKSKFFNFFLPPLGDLISYKREKKRGEYLAKEITKTSGLLYTGIISMIGGLAGLGIGVGYADLVTKVVTIEGFDITGLNKVAGLDLDGVLVNYLALIFLAYLIRVAIGYSKTSDLSESLQIGFSGGAEITENVSHSEPKWVRETNTETSSIKKHSITAGSLKEYSTYIYTDEESEDAKSFP